MEVTHSPKATNTETSLLDLPPELLWPILGMSLNPDIVDHPNAKFWPHDHINKHGLRPTTELRAAINRVQLAFGPQLTMSRMLEAYFKNNQLIASLLSSIEPSADPYRTVTPYRMLGGTFEESPGIQARVRLLKVEACALQYECGWYLEGYLGKITDIVGNCPKLAELAVCLDRVDRRFVQEIKDRVTVMLRRVAMERKRPIRLVFDGKPRVFESQWA